MPGPDATPEPDATPGPDATPEGSPVPGVLARRYRRLLCCYPRAHRRDEMLETLLEAAPPGRTRPTAREAADLIRHGLRARLGRPASRTVAIWAVLATIISGVFAAAFAARAGWEAAEPLPRAAQTSAMLGELLPGQKFRDVEDAPAMFTIYGSPLSWNSVNDLLFGDGNEYALSSVGGTVTGVPARPPRETLELVQARLRESGWTQYRPLVQDTYTTVTARRGNTALTVDVHFTPTVFSGPSTLPEDSILLTASFQRTTPAAVYPCAVVGGVAGAAVAFLLFGWASRRTTGRHATRWAATVLFSVTMVLWWVPTLIAVPLMARHHLAEPHPAWHPMWEWLWQPTCSLLFVTGGGCALLSLALAALPRPRTEAVPTAATG